MRPITIFIATAGGVVAALAMSSQARAASARVLERSPPIEPPEPPAPRLPAPAPSIPAHVVELAATQTTQQPSQPLPLESSRAPRVAAQELFAYVTGLIRSGRGAELGSTSEPNATVMTAQKDMKLLTADGIYGAKTRARGKELLGREFPQRESKARASVPIVIDLPQQAAATPTPTERKIDQAMAAPAIILEASPAAPPPPPSVKVATHSPREAAEALWLYVTQPEADLGTKKAPNDIVRDAQKAMQKLTADGIYGPKTAARITALTGKVAPKRS